jgi:hypothetical protein
LETGMLMFTNPLYSIQHNFFSRLVAFKSNKLHKCFYTNRFLRHVPVIYVDYPGETSLKQVKICVCFWSENRFLIIYLFNFNGSFKRYNSNQCKVFI